MNEQKNPFEDVMPLMGDSTPNPFAQAMPSVSDIQ